MIKFSNNHRTSQKLSGVNEDIPQHSLVIGFS